MLLLIASAFAAEPPIFSPELSAEVPTCDGGPVSCAGITGVEHAGYFGPNWMETKLSQTPGVLVRHGEVLSTWGTTPVLFVDGTRWMTTRGVPR